MDHFRVTRANNHGCNGIATTTMVNGQGRLVVAMVDNNCQCRLKQDNACDKFATSSYDVNPVSQRSMRGGSHIPCSLEPLLVEHGSQRQLALSVMLWCIFQLDRDSHRRRRDASTLSGDEIAGRHTCNHVHPKRIPRIPLSSCLSLSISPLLLSPLSLSLPSLLSPLPSSLLSYFSLPLYLSHLSISSPILLPYLFPMYHRRCGGAATPIKFLLQFP